MKLQWLPQNELVDTPAVTFGFDSVAELINGQLTVGWLGIGGQADEANTLIIAESGVSGETLGRAVIEATKAPLRKHRKGKLTDGTARDVYPIFNGPTLPFRAGLTVHAAHGTWSSLPHAFEAAEILTPRPMPFFEQFAYVTDPPGGWGVQVRIGHLYDAFNSDTDGDIRDWLDNENSPTARFVNKATVIRDRDILDIPLGSHPAVGGPGTRLCYFWAYWTDSALPWVMESREKFK